MEAGSFRASPLATLEMVFVAGAPLPAANSTHVWFKQEYGVH